MNLPIHPAAVPMPLNPNARLWVEALRSGKYKQAFGQLAKDGGLCCLGVACEVAAEHGAIESYDPKRHELPDAVMEWLCLNDECGGFDRAANSLADLNDFRKLSFAQIAEVIESQPKGLFVERRSNIAAS